MDKARTAINNVVNEVQWLIVPRHPQRFEEVAELIQAHGFELQRRTAWPDAGPPPASGHEIWLGDSLGEMALYYGLANVALLGGSFAPLGGQNLIEAAACGCPVVMGPSTFNFAEAAEQALLAGAASRVKDMAEAVQTAVHLAQSPTELARRVQASSDFFEANQGAVQRTASAIKALL